MTTYYISPSGNDTTGNGSSATPWATISKAHTSASSGDTIICKAGTYTWASQAFSKSLTIQGESTPVYNPATKAWTGAIFSGGSGSWINTTSLSLNRLIFLSIPATTSDGLIRFSENLTIQQCIFTGISLAGGSGVNVQGSGMFNEGITNKTLSVSNCIFYDQRGEFERGKESQPTLVVG